MPVHLSADFDLDFLNTLNGFGSLNKQEEEEEVRLTSHIIVSSFLCKC